MVLETMITKEIINYQKFCEAVEYREGFATLWNHCCTFLPCYKYSQKYLYLSDAKNFPRELR